MNLMIWLQNSNYLSTQGDKVNASVFTFSDMLAGNDLYDVLALVVPFLYQKEFCKNLHY